MTVDLFAVRSLLFLPASNPRAIAKARTLPADMVILDLEDAVKPGDKAAARQAAVEAVADDWAMPVAVRINGTGSEWHDEDIAAVASSSAQLAVLPRSSSAAELKGIRDRAGRPVLAMVETAAGVLASAEIARETAALIAGTNDLSADLRLPPRAGRGPLQTALQTIVLSGRAAGVAVFDGVFNALDDSQGFEVECRQGRELGFDGKSLIHPNQVEPCNRVFSPSEAEIERARRLVDAFDGGAERFEDEMIERMHVQIARQLLLRARRD